MWAVFSVFLVYHYSNANTERERKIRWEFRKRQDRAFSSLSYLLILSFPFPQWQTEYFRSIVV